ncbi:hypothetical protein DPMN_093187 [Dreissena polymorpha]|uniref:Uncharacterized protein n=1 Tax=Dreissena polymorpha TaxID=45954 RepID=A0A9D4L3Q5_DREPO|nr:hypothetical protein DPMN_093187 [Dreissena polymorpha]
MKISNNKDQQQQRSTTTKISNNKDQQQQRSATTKISNNKDQQQQRSATTKISNNKDQQQQRSASSRSKSRLTETGAKRKRRSLSSFRRRRLSWPIESRKPQRRPRL